MQRSSRPKGGAARHQQQRGLSRRGDRRGMAATIMRNNPRPKTLYGEFCDNVRTPRPEGSSNGDNASPRRYPLLTCTHNNRECEHGSARRLARETRVLDGRAIGGCMVRPLTSFPDRYPDDKQRKAKEMTGKFFQHGGKSAIFVCGILAPPPPLALEVTGTSTRSKAATGGAASILGRGLRDATAGSTSDRMRRVFLLTFPLLSPPRPKSRGS
jgi:hypothetical protein